VQSLNPVKGKGRRRGSRDPLLARGIAVPRGVSRRVPALGGMRSVLRRSPKAVRLGKLGPDRARGKWLVLSVLFIATAVAYGAWIGGQTSKLFGLFTGGVEHLAVAAGFGVKRVNVEGQLHATDADITAALNAGPDTMMLGFDTDSAKARLEAVPWIRHAQVMRFLPSTLQVVVEERTPYAVWQKDGQTYVIDDEGVVLARALRDAYRGLPLVVGEGAGKSASQLFAALAPYAVLKEKMLAAIRVGDRRWTLKLTSGLEIMLPDDNVDEALASLTKLEQRQGVLERDIAAVDLRLLDRITVRLRETASAAPADGAAPEEVPTSSTKVTRAKGKT
jgi:cell division protein FtsQ